MQENLADRENDVRRANAGIHMLFASTSRLCGECHGLIQVGTEYHYSYVWVVDIQQNQKLQEFRTCSECQDNWEILERMFWDRSMQAEFSRMDGTLRAIIEEAVAVNILDQYDPLATRWLGEPNQLRFDFERVCGLVMIHSSQIF